MRAHPVIIARLWLRFVGHCLWSGIATARIILMGARPPAGMVRMPLAPMNATGAAVFGALVTLTPGSTVIDIDLQRREILLHLLDTRTAETTLASVRRDFERDLCRLFPEKRP